MGGVRGGRLRVAGSLPEVSTPDEGRAGRGTLTEH